MTIKEYINTKTGIWKGIHFMKIGYRDSKVKGIIDVNLI